LIVQPFDAGQCDAGARLLAAAFRDNPLNRAVLGGSPRRRERANFSGIRASLPVALAHGKVLKAEDAMGLAGVLIAAAPQEFPFPPPSAVRRISLAWVQGLRASKRWAEVFETLCEVHPVAPLHYLATLGVAPHRQGRGIGGRLLTRWLNSVDRDRASAYLETDRPSNTHFYAGFGFRVVRRLEVHGTTVWCMERPPTPARSN
jgi:ribosomal protein S18 acetylase RimI-like enzyme